MITLAAVAPVTLRAAENPSERFNYQEVFDLLKAHLPGTTEEALQDAAARGLIQELAPKVRLVTEADSTSTATNKASVPSFKVFDAHYGYVRLPKFHEGVTDVARPGMELLIATNQLKGLILDLRFAGGEIYSEAARFADAFFPKEQPLIDWGKGAEMSTAKTNIVQLPVAVLVNGSTAGAAEALAALLRDGNVGLLIGSKTSGQASRYQEFELATGQRLRIATAPITVGENMRLTASGVTTDIAVAVPEMQEKRWLEDPYQPPIPPVGQSKESDKVAQSGTAPRRHLNEADLVRMLREGEIPDLTLNPPGERVVDAKPIVHDQALSRALDFLKGLALVRKSPPN